MLSLVSTGAPLSCTPIRMLAPMKMLPKILEAIVTSVRNGEIRLLIRDREGAVTRQT